MSVRYYPRSFRKLLLLAFLLAVLPLAMALLQAMSGIDHFAQQSRTAVGETAKAARASRQLLEEATGLERLARQMLILRDANVLDDYETLRGRFKSSSSELSLLPLDEAQLTLLNQVIDTEQALFEKLRRGAGEASISSTERARLAEDYAGLSALAREMVDVSNALIDREMTLLQEGADETQRRLWIFLPAMLALGSGVALLATLLIARPIRELDDAIRRLGGGDLVPAIRINGPGDLERLGQRLDWLRLRLVELEAQKSRFLRHVSHELKTPLTAMREGASLLADGTVGPLAPEQREVVEILQAKSLQLQALIERLLAAQREMEGLGHVQPESVHLSLIVKKVLEDHRLPALAHNLEFRLDVTPVRVTGDAAKLATVLDNLVSNAIRHSPEGAMINLRLYRQGDAALLEVRDQGPGIASAERENIFDWFYRGAAPPGDQVTGSGFGLAIARELAQAHHGSLDLLPEEGKGAAFRLTLPLAYKGN
jgi:two-component system, NtrC family, sensor histidine kinase GlrK